ADGRGVAASLMLGADGVMLGSRLWASPECLVHPHHQAAALAGDGDATLRQVAPDIVDGYDWPAEFTGRVLRSGATQAGTFVGEAIGLMHDVLPAALTVVRVVEEAEAVIQGRGAAMLV